MPAARIAATEPAAERAAAELAAAGGGGVDTVIGGFLGAAAARPDALLAPVGALVAGAGVGLRCIDGRTRQPGHGAARPRGWQTGEVIPPAASAAVPYSFAALALLHAYGGAMPLEALVAPALAIAKQAHATERAAVLAAFGHRGAAALRARPLAPALLRAAGHAAGGLLTEDDLAAVVAGDSKPEWTVATGELQLAWPAWPAPATARTSRYAEVVVAADARGYVAVLAYWPDPQGVDVPELGLQLSRDAEPVRRGVPRLTPATPRPATLPMVAWHQQATGWLAAAGARCQQAADLLQPPSADSLGGKLGQLREQLGATAAVAASVERGRTAVSRSSDRER